MKPRYFCKQTNLLAALLVFVCSGCIHHNAQQQNAAVQRALANQNQSVFLTHEQALHDARQLLRLLEDTHPDPYLPMYGKVAFKRHAQNMLQSIPEDGISVKDFANRLQSFLARLHDGHSFVRLGKTGSWPKPTPTLPVQFGVFDTGLYVQAFDAEAMRGTYGYKLVTVEGHSIHDLIGELGKHTAVENEFHALGKLKQALVSKNQLGLLLQTGGENQVKLELESPGKSRVTVKVAHREGLDNNGVAFRDIHRFDAWQQPPKKWTPQAASTTETFRTNLASHENQFWFHVFKDESLAYFRVPNIMGREAFEIVMQYQWGDANKMLKRYYERLGIEMPTSFEQALLGVPSFFDMSVKLLQKMKEHEVQDLIIDLRGNGGGVTPMVFPFLYQLFGDAYFAKQWPAQYITVISPLYLEKYNTTLEQWKKTNKQPGFEVGDYFFEQEPKEVASVKRDRQIAEYKEKGMSFAGRLAALDGQPIYTPKRLAVVCDEKTYSAAFHFAYFLSHMGAKVVGIPPGQAPNAFMEVTPFVLDASGIEGSISNSAQIFLPNAAEGRVFQPDFKTTYEVFEQYDFDPFSLVFHAIDLLRQGSIEPLKISAE